MSEQSAKPYLVRALYEWCVEQGFTPYLEVRVNAKTRVPMDYVRDGVIVLNVSPIATHKLTMDNEWTLFNARFNGVTQELAVPFSAVVGIFAKETGYGLHFSPGAELSAAEPSTVTATTAPALITSVESTDATKQPTPTKTKPTLTIVK